MYSLCIMYFFVIEFEASMIQQFLVVSAETSFRKLVKQI